MTHVKHHGIAHVALIIILFVLTIIIFGGWAQGPLTSGLFLGFKVYGLISGGMSDPGNVESIGGDVLTLATVFFINLVLYYLLSSIIIFLWNLVFRK